MSILYSIWKVGQWPQALLQGRFDSKVLLEDMIVAAPEILSPEWTIIGREEDTGHGGRNDLVPLTGEPILIKPNRVRIEIQAGQSVSSRQP